MKILSPSENPSKPQFWIKKITPILIIISVIFIYFYSQKINNEKKVESIKKAITIDVISLSQVARGINIYNDLSEGDPLLTLKSMGNFKRIEKELKDKNILAKSISLLTKNEVNLYDDLRFIGFLSQDNDVCKEYNKLFQNSSEIKKVTSIENGYENITNKSNPFCIEIENNEKAKNGKYVLLKIKNQIPKKSMPKY